MLTDWCIDFQGNNCYRQRIDRGLALILADTEVPKTLFDMVVGESVVALDSQLRLKCYLLLVSWSTYPDR